MYKNIRKLLNELKNDVALKKTNLRRNFKKTLKIFKWNANSKLST